MRCGEQAGQLWSAADGDTGTRMDTAREPFSRSVGRVGFGCHHALGGGAGRRAPSVGSGRGDLGYRSPLADLAAGEATGQGDPFDTCHPRLGAAGCFFSVALECTIVARGLGFDSCHHPLAFRHAATLVGCANVVAVVDGPGLGRLVRFADVGPLQPRDAGADVHGRYVRHHGVRGVCISHRQPARVVVQPARVRAFRQSQPMGIAARTFGDHGLGLAAPIRASPGKARHCFLGLGARSVRVVDRAKRLSRRPRRLGFGRFRLLDVFRSGPQGIPLRGGGRLAGLRLFLAFFVRRRRSLGTLRAIARDGRGRFQQRCTRPILPHDAQSGRRRSDHGLRAGEFRICFSLLPRLRTFLRPETSASRVELALVGKRRRPAQRFGRGCRGMHVDCLRLSSAPLARQHRAIGRHGLRAGHGHQLVFRSQRPPARLAFSRHSHGFALPACGRRPVGARGEPVRLARNRTSPRGGGCHMDRLRFRQGRAPRDSGHFGPARSRRPGACGGQRRRGDRTPARSLPPASAQQRDPLAARSLPARREKI